MTKSVVVVEDDRGLREQLAAILRTAPDIKCVGAFATGEEALAKVPALRPDVVLMDIGLPGISGIECVAQLKKMESPPQIVMVTVYEDSDRIFRALKAGANGYLVKSSPPEELLDAVRDVDTGGAPMSSHIACKVVEHFHGQEPEAPEKAKVSPREQQVLALLASGFIYKEIGDQLGISVETVRSHVKNICQKMHVRNRVEAVARLQAKTSS
ncbi:MAG TPA: response regulator transcription factor [Verrucomicrobiae bacterium]|jgi:DNA-binding NarL/FixJ family response regulator